MKSRQRNRASIGWTSARAVVLVLLVHGLSACTPSRPPLPPLIDLPARPGGTVSEALPAGSCETQDCDFEGPLVPPAGSEDDCTTGTCKPNAKGIYVATDNNYCILGWNDEPYLCLEHFINTNNGVKLKTRDGQTPGRIRDLDVTAELEGGTDSSYIPVKLIEISSTRSELAIRYETVPGGVTHTATGLALSKLRLLINSSALEVPYHLKIEYAGVLPKSGVHQYSIKYSLLNSGKSFANYCQEGSTEGHTSFLEGKKIDGQNGAMTSDAQVVTMSCSSGAIASCLDWSYAPWNPKTGAPERSEYLFASCLQAKRAAYFVGKGDLTSYTKAGTLICRRDQYGINSEYITKVEAIWSPLGAVCFNPENARGYQNPAYPQVDPAAQPMPPRCDDLHWSKNGKLATGLSKGCLLDGGSAQELGQP